MHTVSRSTVSRRLAVAIAVILTLGFAGVPVVRADVTSAPVLAETAVDRARLLDAVVDTIESRFVDPDLLKRLNWLERARNLRASVLSAPTTEDAVARINDLIAELKTAHTGL